MILVKLDGLAQMVADTDTDTHPISHGHPNLCWSDRHQKKPLTRQTIPIAIPILCIFELIVGFKSV